MTFRNHESDDKGVDHGHPGEVEEEAAGAEDGKEGRGQLDCHKYGSVLEGDQDPRGEAFQGRGEPLCHENPGEGDDADPDGEHEGEEEDDHGPGGEGLTDQLGLLGKVESACQANRDGGENGGRQIQPSPSQPEDFKGFLFIIGCYLCMRREEKQVPRALAKAVLTATACSFPIPNSSKRSMAKKAMLYMPVRG